MTDRECALMMYGFLSAMLPNSQEEGKSYTPSVMTPSREALDEFLTRVAESLFVTTKADPDAA